MRKIKTKPFDLEKALKGAPVVTRDGRRAVIIEYVPQSRFGVRFMVVDYPDILSADTMGNYFSHESSYDLFLLDEETQKGGEK